MNTLLSWEKLYGSHISQIERRALDRAKGDFSGKLDLLHPSIASKLSIPTAAWDSADNTWYSKEEENLGKRTSSPQRRATRNE